MKVTMIERPPDDELGTGAELWVEVLSNEVLTLPGLLAQLTAEQAELLSHYSPKPSWFYPHMITEDERMEHGYTYGDTWAFPKIGA